MLTNHGTKTTQVVNSLTCRLDRRHPPPRDDLSQQELQQSAGYSLAAPAFQRHHYHTLAAVWQALAGMGGASLAVKVILFVSFFCLLPGCAVPTISIEKYQSALAYKPKPAVMRMQANVVVTVTYTMPTEATALWKRWGNSDASIENYEQAFRNVIFDDMAQSKLFNRVDREETAQDTDLLIQIRLEDEAARHEIMSMTVLDPATKGSIKAYHKEAVPGLFETHWIRDLMADLKSNLISDFKDVDFARRRQLAEEERTRRLKLAEEARQLEISRKTDLDESGKELFKLQPDEQFSVSQATEFLITWKNRHLANVLRNSPTAELRNYVDQIEHTILQATDASEKEKDEAQRLIAGGANGAPGHTDLARAYALRIEVLKPILAAIKEEIANRAR
jgi:hypothetical protein